MRGNLLLCTAAALLLAAGCAGPVTGRPVAADQPPGSSAGETSTIVPAPTLAPTTVPAPTTTVRAPLATNTS